MVSTMLADLAGALAHLAHHGRRLRHRLAHPPDALDRALDRRPALLGLARHPPRHLVGLPGQRADRLDRTLHLRGAGRGGARRLGDPLAALRHRLDGPRHLLDRGVEFCSTAVARFSVIAPTSSIDAAISLIDDEVSSAAAASSSALPDTPLIDRAISSMAAAVSFTDAVSDSVSRLIALHGGDDLRDRGGHLLGRADISCVVAVTCWIEAAVS